VFIAGEASDVNENIAAAHAFKNAGLKVIVFVYRVRSPHSC
jgi:hypothetical protein